MFDFYDEDHCAQIIVQLTRTDGNIVGPRSVAHTKDHWMTTSYVARFTFVSHDGTVASSTTVQDGKVSVRCFRKWRTLRSYKTKEELILLYVLIEIHNI